MLVRRCSAALIGAALAFALVPGPYATAAPTPSPSPSFEGPDPSSPETSARNGTQSPAASEPAAAAQRAIPVTLPDPVTAFTATAGTAPGEIQFQWAATGRNTTSFVVETGTTPFGGVETGLPAQGRNAKAYAIPATARVAKLTAAQVAQSGAPLGSGRQLYLRISSVYTDPTSKINRVVTGDFLRGTLPLGMGPTSSGKTVIRAGTFNVRTAKATYDLRPWPKRADDVAREIASHKLDVVALQELSPGRADGKKKSTKGVLRQTTSLLASLRRMGATQYQLVRTTSYVKGGKPSGSQGTRIMYDAKRFRMLSTCRETTKGKTYNASCTIKLPLLKSDKENLRRRAAYAMLQERSTGKKFLMVSAHLDQRHSSRASTEIAYNRLRGAQAQTIVNALKKLNPKKRKVILGADLNSWQSNRIGDAARDVLVTNGFYDTVSAVTATNLEYDTSNRFAVTMVRNPYGPGTRIDAVMISGTKGAYSFENVMAVSSAARPSDHNLLVSVVRI